MQGHALDLFDPVRLDALQDDLFGRVLPIRPWVHPPPMLLMVLPFASLPYAWALGAWSLLGLCAYVLAIGRVVLLVAPATYVNLLVGQTGLVVGALYLGALRLLERRPWVAGALIGLIAVKPHLGILIPVALLGARAWSALAASPLSACALAMLSGWAFGWEAWRLWFLQVLPYQTANLQVAGVIRGMPSALVGAYFLGLPAAVGWIVQLPFTAVGIGATWWALAGMRRGSVGADTAFAILLLSTSIAIPYF